MTAERGYLQSNAWSNKFKNILQINKFFLSLHRFWKEKHHIGSLAQLVQSICLTSRGSAVRIRQLPLKKRKRLRYQSLFLFCRLLWVWLISSTKQIYISRCEAPVFQVWMTELELNGGWANIDLLFSKVFALRLCRSNPSTPTKSSWKCYSFLFCRYGCLQQLGLLVKIVDKIGAFFTYWSKIVDKWGKFAPFITSIWAWNTRL